MAAEIKLPKGVELRSGSLRIVFTYKGVRCRPTLKGIAPTKSNIRFAEQKRNTVLYEIANGSFNYAAHFPNDPKAALFSGSYTKRVPTVGEILDKVLAIKKARVAPSTFKDYRNKSERYIRPAFSDRLATEVASSDIEEWIAVDLDHLANKTINEILIIARAIFDRARRDGVIDQTPMAFIENGVVVKQEPDPFTRAEIEKIVTTKTHQESERNMAELAMWCGLSISEFFALAWEDIDRDNWTIRVGRVKVHGVWKVPKTAKRERVIELVDPAIDVLKRQQSISLIQPAIDFEVLQRDNKTLRTEPVTIVFPSTSTGRVCNYKDYRVKFWQPHLKKSKVKYRAPNHCRHTFASQMLTLGMPKEWVATQLGHSGTKMIEQHYGKWIREDAPHMAKLASELIQNAPTAPQRKLKSL